MVALTKALLAPSPPVVELALLRSPSAPNSTAIANLLARVANLEASQDAIPRLHCRLIDVEANVSHPAAAATAAQAAPTGDFVKPAELEVLLSNWAKDVTDEANDNICMVGNTIAACVNSDNDNQTTCITKAFDKQNAYVADAVKTANAAAKIADTAAATAKTMQANPSLAKTNTGTPAVPSQCNLGSLQAKGAQRGATPAVTSNKSAASTNTYGKVAAPAATTGVAPAKVARPAPITTCKRRHGTDDKPGAAKGSPAKATSTSDKPTIKC
ncbi:hypothetical protein CcaCcLH18_12335 [Colletotrichum camelliae]|nr:hypothetical protein CcaCcLH18_12335 [Colletotrichum camelliae]